MVSPFEFRSRATASRRHSQKSNRPLRTKICLCHPGQLCCGRIMAEPRYQAILGVDRDELWPIWAILPPRGENTSSCRQIADFTLFIMTISRCNRECWWPDWGISATGGIHQRVSHRKARSTMKRRREVPELAEKANTPKWRIGVKNHRLTAFEEERLTRYGSESGADATAPGQKRRDPLHCITTLRMPVL